VTIPISEILAEEIAIGPAGRKYPGRRPDLLFPFLEKSILKTLPSKHYPLKTVSCMGPPSRY
jgi:hypothetical protein